MAGYPQFSEEFVWDDLSMDRGWAYYAWKVENDGWLQFSGVKRKGKGYVGMEVDSLMKQAKQHGLY